MTGQTTSRDFPTTGGAFITTTPQPPPLGSPNDAFVTKLNATGSALVYSTLLGGGQDIDDGLGIAVDGAGNAYVTGQTGSSDFPVTAGAFHLVNNGGGDVFVSKFAPGGTSLVYSTLLGGAGPDEATSIAVDASGQAAITGFTQSSDFPVVNEVYGRVLGDARPARSTVQVSALPRNVLVEIDAVVAVPSA